MHPQMPITNGPKDGDFASYLDSVASRTDSLASKSNAHARGSLPQEIKPERQSINQVIEQGQEPTDEFLEEFNALNIAPELSDEELERQALSASGDDGDSRTPE